LGHNMKKIIILISLVFLIAIPAQAENSIRNENQTTLYATEEDTGPMQSVDRFGNLLTRVIDPSSGLSQSVVPESGSVGLNGTINVPQALFLVGTDTIEAASTTTVLNLTSHAARIGDWITPTGGTAGNINVGIPVCATATNTVTLCYPLPATPSTDAIKIERPNPARAVAFNGVQQATDTIPPLVIRNENAAAINTTNLAYGVFSANREGALYTSTSTLFNDANNGKLAVVDEDIAFAASDALTKVGGQANSAIFQSVGTTGDVAPFSMDLGNRLVTTNAPAGEMWYACSDAETGTSTNAIKAAVASNRMYVTSFTCSNTSAVASQITFLDSVTAIAIGSIPALATGGNYHATFPIPLRMAVNTQLGYIMTTTATSTTCCAAGYISTI
jgi:hypothetical protein